MAVIFFCHFPLRCGVSGNLSLGFFGRPGAALRKAAFEVDFPVYSSGTAKGPRGRNAGRGRADRGNFYEKVVYAVARIERKVRKITA